MKTSKNQKKAFLTFLGALLSAAIIAQDRPSPASTATGEINGTTVTINYSSPGVKGRVIWGGLVPYDKVWRAGANEATTFEFSDNVVVEGEDLAAGKYGFFVIPGKTEWTIIFNNVPDQWGAFNYDQGKDALRVTVSPAKSDTMNERMLYKVNDDGVSLLWENLEVPISIE